MEPVVGPEPRSCRSCAHQTTCTLRQSSQFAVLGRGKVSPLLAASLPMPCLGELYQAQVRVRPASRLFENWTPPPEVAGTPELDIPMGEKGLPI